MEWHVKNLCGYSIYIEKELEKNGKLILPAVLTGFLMDLCIGDPRWMYHPVCMIGNAITACEKWLRAWFPKTKRGEQMAESACILHCERVCSDSGRAFISRIPSASCSRIYPGIVYVLADAGDKISENRKHEGL